MPRRYLSHLLTVIAVALLTGLAVTKPAAAPGRWMAGDFHQHSTFTDGAFPTDQVLIKGFEYGLGWAANSEHGGSGYRDGQDRAWSDPKAYPQNPIKGDKKLIERKVKQGGEEKTVSLQVMWRWQSLSEYAWNIIQRVRRDKPDNLAATGLEWSVPSHEHCSVGVVAQDATPIAEFEYRFDRGDEDSSGGPDGRWTGKSFENDHAKAVAGVAWMQRNHPDSGWVVFAHPERASAYTVADFRDFHDAGPTVVFGFEGLPGHQRSADRGGYKERAVGQGTYGGAGFYIAEVGGLWDALLGEGRHWWTFVSSDFHSLNGDFWPGQYAKTWTWVQDGDGDGRYTLADIPGGLRSGNTFCVHGDLIDRLDFRVEGQKRHATMGGTLEAKKGKPVEVKIRFRSPATSAAGEAPQVRAVQLISGEVGDRAPKFLPDGKTPNPAYADDRNPTAKVVALYQGKDLKKAADGWYETPTFKLRKLDRDLYFRIRGTNLAPGTANETDARGNPLPDSLMPAEAESERTANALRDLWFYSNPVFVTAN
ncbi:MAG: hypothetical protein GC160_02315 [Acidobacteria bacterium]|nr:hypothetical protein [Acidobacteriota bacterium]